MPAPPKKITFITGNANKLAEVTAILADLPLSTEIVSFSADLPELQGTIEDISRAKVLQAVEIVKGPVLVEDTCLSFNAMGELPGPYIKWFLQQLGATNLHKMLDGFEDKTGKAICTFAYCAGPGETPILFQGVTDGTIVQSRGHTNFGWDSCFEYDGQTYAQMDKADKNKISHRGRALQKFKSWLLEQSE